MLPQLRVAHPTSDLERIVAMYREGLDLDELGHFRDHEGFDGVMLGVAGGPYHLEFTHRPGHPETTRPSAEALLVFYLPDPQEWHQRCEKMRRAGFLSVPPNNPYWARAGQTFEDPDGYRVVIHHSDWP
ncbi:VOC family protein [Sedimenticola thiotaurini]|uniref:VOC domain-containing protein n=1 Tax=Sedimenticola thiotaurini TaxID=1543721 RepID=A0A0F7K4J3_9GAMM|nr:VOC family protein [Sedimenticola thiotaurini]AKH21898.1 hypothetical protein AAY24_17855 [Sedimenticola thiotaurini]